MASLRGMSVIQLLDIHNSSSATAPSPKIKFGMFVICCFSMLSVYLYSVLFKWFQHSFLYSVQNPYSVFIWSRLRCLWRPPRGGLFDYCVDNAENEGECNFNTWQRINRTKIQNSSKIQRNWGPEDPWISCISYFVRGLIKVADTQGV